MHQLLHWVLPSLNPKDRYHDYFLCSVALELLKVEGINNSVTFAKLLVEVIHTCFLPFIIYFKTFVEKSFGLSSHLISCIWTFDHL